VIELSKLLDGYLTANIVEGTVKDANLLTHSVTIPSKDYGKLSDKEIETYLQELIAQFGRTVNILGSVRVAVPTQLSASVSCTEGQIPVSLTVVERANWGVHQLIVSAAVEPED